MNENDVFNGIDEDFMYCELVKKEAKIISHRLLGGSYILRLEYRNGETYDATILKENIKDFLQNFKPIDKKEKEYVPGELLKKVTEIKPKQNTISNLGDELFEIIGLLKRNEITNDKAIEISNVSQTIINLAKLEMDYLKAFKIVDRKIKLLE